MSIAHRIAKVRAHLPADIELTGTRGSFGDCLSAVKGGRGAALFVTKGVPFSPKQAAANFAARLGATQ